MIGLPIMYIIIFVENIILLKKAVKSKKILNWIILFIIEASMIFVATDNINFFETIPASGFMGGLNYIGDYIISIAASFLFSGELLVSLLTLILVKVKKNNDNNSD